MEVQSDPVRKMSELIFGDPKSEDSVSIDTRSSLLYFRSKMKTANVGELRNHYSRLLKWLEAGEEILIRRRGRVLARLIPERGGGATRVDWTKSAAYLRDRTRERKLSAEESASVLNDSRGEW